MSTASCQLVSQGRIRAAFLDQEVPRWSDASMIDSMPGPDRDDHAHAAAAASVAPSVLLTANLEDFPVTDLAERSGPLVRATSSARPRRTCPG